jgi:meso-butanediol dehydrogenase/(S,S)-butanediol dehydrogenase/diacetyl reductase
MVPAGNDADGKPDNRPVLLITGATAGLGLATVKRFAIGGYRIVAVARGRQRLDEIAGELPERTEVATLAADVADPQAPAEAVRLAMERFGRIDCLINNAGSGKWGKVHETDDATLEDVIALSLKAPFRFAREVVPHMKPGSSILSIGSTWGVIGGMGGGIYCAVKAGLVGLIRSLAADYGPIGIRSNLIAPGVIRTDMTEDYWNTDYFQRINHEMTPFDRDGTPQDVAETAFFLATKPGSYINGQVIALDGGWSVAKYLAPQSLYADRVQSA